MSDRGKHEIIWQRIRLPAGDWQDPHVFISSIDIVAEAYLGCGLMLQARTAEGDFTRAAEFLDRALAGLRAAGHQEFLVCGLLARAALARERGDFRRAWDFLGGSARYRRARRVCPPSRRGMLDAGSKFQVSGFKFCHTELEIGHTTFRLVS